MARPRVTALFVSAADVRTDIAIDGPQQACAALQAQDWRTEVAQAVAHTGQFPCLHFVHADDPRTWLSISGEEENGRFMAIMEVVVRPGLLGFWRREAASLDLHGIDTAQAAQLVDRFCSLDRPMLCAWVRSRPWG